MEPALDERGDTGCLRPAGCAAAPPQWSPLSTSGATRTISPPGRHPAPSRNGARSRRAGRHRPAQAPPPSDHGAAMEPALDERGDLIADPPAGEGLGAAMEPALDERGDHDDPATTSSSATSRNGARSRRAGRHAGRLGGAGVLAAAMEPALDERGDMPAASAVPASLLPQWSPLSTSGATTQTAAEAQRKGTPQWSPLSTSGATC